MAGKNRITNEETEVKEVITTDASVETNTNEDEIIVNDPQLLRPVELPLVVQLPASASKAQIEYAKILNAYAYINPKKWNLKKDSKTIEGKVVLGLIDKLKALKDAPDPIEDENRSLRIGRKSNLLG